MSGHAPVPAVLQLPDQYKAVELKLQHELDPELRLRRALDYEHDPKWRGRVFVLERRATRTPPPRHNVSEFTLSLMSDEQRARALRLTDSKIASQDGYHVVGYVSTTFLDSPNLIFEQLKANGNDLHEPSNGADQAMQRIVDEQQAADEKWEKDLESDARHIFAEGYDIAERVGDPISHAGRYRINNAGHPDASGHTRDVAIDTEGAVDVLHVSSSEQSDSQLHD